MNAEQTAQYLGISVGQLMLSFYRGLPPGNLGVKIDGQLQWDKSELVLPPTGDSSELDDADSEDQTLDSLSLLSTWPGDEDEEE